jgi:molybdenum cofactor cytidylyltransferase
MTTSDLAGVLLAAGGSSRLGQSKQLIKWRGLTLVRRAAELALDTCGAGVTVVTGANVAAIQQELQGLKLNFVNNSDWQLGMGSSLRVGLQVAPNDAEAVLIMLCDQPLVTNSTLTDLAEQWFAKPDQPAAASYGDTIGVPAIVPRVLLDELATLPNDCGARSWLRSRTDISQVPMPHAEFDIDTPEDLKRLQCI